MCDEHNDLSRQLYDEACEKIHAGDFADAIQLFRRSLELEVNYKSLLHLGRCYLELGQYREAIVPLAAATTLNGQGIAPYNLAIVMQNLGDLNFALKLSELAVARQPDLRRARILMEEIKMKLEEQN